MKRKLVRQGHNTLTLSLPRKWCDRNKIKEGEEIDVIERGETLILSKEISKGSGKVSVDITGLNRSTIILLISSLYRYGYDFITITTKDKKARYYWTGKDISTDSIIHFALSRLIGTEIVSSSKEVYKIEVITDDSREKFDIVLRNIFRLLIEIFDTFIEGARKKDRDLMESIQLKHINIKKFINYGLRLLNKFGYKEAEKTTFYFSIINFLSKIGEIIKNFAGYSITEGSLNFSKDFSDWLDEINQSLKLYYQLFYKYSIKQVSQLHKNRDIIKRKFYEEHHKLSKDNLFVFSNMMQIFDILLELSELRISIGYS